MIKFIGNAVLWRDKVNGNTYHSVRITRTKDNMIIACPCQYGYGEHYRQSALEAMATAKWLPPKYRGKNSSGSSKALMYERENKYPIHWTVCSGTHKECRQHGEA